MKFKKLNAILLSCIFTLLLFPKINNLKVYNADVTTQFDTFAESYFENLIFNFGSNNYGACGYVAVGMLLSYYDTFHDDRIIPDDYVKKTIRNDNLFYACFDSPGGYADYITLNNPSDTVQDYLEIVEEKAKDKYLHSYLLMLGNKLGFYPKTDSVEAGMAATTTSELIQLLNTYLQHNTTFQITNEGALGRSFHSFSSADYTLVSKKRGENGETEESIKVYAIAKIQAGIPVLLGVQKNTGTETVGHMLVAYDVDDSNNIFCNYGYSHRIYNHHEPEFEGYTIYDTVISLEWNTPHNCSNNYVVQTKDTNGNVISEKTYCYEHKDIITYDHVCSYGEWVTTDSKHTKTCHCTEKIEGAHTYDSNNTCTVCEHHTHDYHYSYVSRTQCKGVCEYCNYQIITTHNINLLTKVCRQCFARFSNDGVEVPINNLPPDIVCTKNHQHNSSCVIVARE